MTSIHNGQQNYTLEMANKVYVEEGFPILEAYKSTIDQHYSGLFESVNFEQIQETTNKINHFVEEATHDKIHDLIQANSLVESTRLLLINAIYFIGNWAEKFNENHTKKEIFYASPGKEKPLDMMKKKAEFIYSENKDYQVLGMPYVGEDVFMFILLPKERYGLSQVLANLSGKELLDLVQMRQKTEVHVVLPKFKLESTHHLNEPLKKLGIARAFEDNAQFEGISQIPLKISEVLQKAFIEMNEEGTVTTAATAIHTIVPLMSKMNDASFKADYPFAFFLATNNDGNTQILFNGIFYG